MTTPKQFTRRLQLYDGEYTNYFSGSGFEDDLKRGRLIQRFDLGEHSCVLLFEEHEQPFDIDEFLGPNPNAAVGYKPTYTKP